MKRFLFLVGCFFSTIAAANTWNLLAVTENSGTYYYDSDSVVRTGSKVRAWIALVHTSQNQIIKEPAVNLALELWEIDTNNKAYRFLQLNLYNGAHLVKIEHGPSKWSYITPSDPTIVGSIIFDYVTHKRKAELSIATDNLDALIAHAIVYSDFIKMAQKESSKNPK